MHFQTGVVGTDVKLNVTHPCSTVFLAEEYSKYILFQFMLDDCVLSFPVCIDFFLYFGIPTIFILLRVADD